MVASDAERVTNEGAKGRDLPIGLSKLVILDGVSFSCLTNRPNRRSCPAHTVHSECRWLRFHSTAVSSLRHRGRAEETGSLAHC